MKNASGITIAAAIAGAALMLNASSAMAHEQARVNWSVSIGTPYPVQVYSPPPVVYVQPRPVYVEPQPVYVERGPIVQYRSYYPQPYYVEEVRYGNHHHWKHHHHHGYDWD